MSHHNRKPQFKSPSFKDTRKSKIILRTSRISKPSCSKAQNSITKFIEGQQTKNRVDVGRKQTFNNNYKCSTDESCSRKRAFEHVEETSNRISNGGDIPPVSKFVAIAFDKVICKITSSKERTQKKRIKEIGRKTPAVARCSIVDSEGQVLLDTYIKPQHPIINYKTMTTGITAENITLARPYEETKQLIVDLLKDKYIVGHKLRADMELLELGEWLLKNVRYSRELWRNYSLIRIYQKKHAGHPNERRLNAALHGRHVEKDDMDSLEYSKAMMELYKLIRDDWESLIQTKYGPKKSKFNESGPPLTKRQNNHLPDDPTPHNLSGPPLTKRKSNQPPDDPTPHNLSGPPLTKRKSNQPPDDPTPHNLSGPPLTKRKSNQPPDDPTPHNLSGPPLTKRQRNQPPDDYTPHNLPTEHTPVHVAHCEVENSENVSDSVIPPLSKLVAVDCEMVGVRGVGLNKKGRPREDHSLGRCSIVDADGGILLDMFVRPDKPIVNFHTKYSGIREFHMNIAESHQRAIEIITQILKDKILVGHSIHCDLAVMEHNITTLVNEGRIREISQCKTLTKLYHNKMGAWDGIIGLKKLTDALLGRPIQTGEHCSVEDARATMELYRLVRDEWEQEISENPTKTKPLTIKRNNVTTFETDEESGGEDITQTSNGTKNSTENDEDSQGSDSSERKSSVKKSTSKIREPALNEISEKEKLKSKEIKNSLKRRTMETLQKLRGVKSSQNGKIAGKS